MGDTRIASAQVHCFPLGMYILNKFYIVITGELDQRNAQPCIGHTYDFLYVTVVHLHDRSGFQAKFVAEKIETFFQFADSETEMFNRLYYKRLPF